MNELAQSTGPFLRLMEHVAYWIGHRTQDQKVWGSIPTAAHV